MKRAWWVMGCVGLAAAAAAFGCGGKQAGVGTSCEEDCPELPPCGPGDDGEDCEKTTHVFVDTIEQGIADKVDLLLMIDNSPSMAEKQRLLQEVVPNFIERLVNPVCVDPSTGDIAPPPYSIDDPCPAPYERQFAPVRDIHVGVISSSLGSYGSNACVPDPVRNDPLRDEMQDDHGRMLGARPRAFAAGLDLANGVDGTPGFLSWDVTGDRSQDLGDLQSQFQTLVGATGTQGCDYEASLEAWYRFLVDPVPPATVEIVPCPGGGDCAQPVGRDEQLLAQRTAFLRPDSVLAIVMLSDENDCSVRGTGQLYYAVRDISLPASTAVCANNPNDPCCHSCAFSVPEGCTPDPSCEGSDGPFRTVPDEENPMSLRCWQQKRRFGVDFLYPVERYVNALSSMLLCPAKADLAAEDCSDPVLNPIFTDLSGSGGRVRSPDQIFLAGIVGVPWQAIAADMDSDGNRLPERDPNGDGVVENLAFLTADQMSGRAADGVQRDTWAAILGSPESSPPILPTDMLMHEAIAPRTGTTTDGIPLGSPSGALYENPINGHERNILQGDDLQYACIFPLSEPKDCVTEDALGNACDCLGPTAVQEAQNPLCQSPVDGSYGEVQYAAKVYPAPRILSVLRSFGHNAIVTSACPANTTDPTLPSYGYRPAVDAIINGVEEGLRARCLPREFSFRPPSGPGEPQDIPCIVAEAIPIGGVGCDRPGRAPAPDVEETGLRRLEEEGRCGAEGTPACDTQSWTFCEILPATADENGDGILDCLQTLPQTSEAAWCYVDPGKGAGDAALVEKCPASEKRLLRFVDPDAATPATGAIVLVGCVGPDFGP